MIRRQVPPWKHREHLFTPENILRYEKEMRVPMYHKRVLKIVPKPLPNGPVYTPCFWCMAKKIVTPFICAECKGEFIDFNEERRTINGQVSAQVCAH